MTNLIERCNKLYYEMNISDCEHWHKEIEAFARECERGGYRKGVEDALTTLAVLDSSRAVGSGATLADGIRAIRALLSKGEG